MSGACSLVSSGRASDLGNPAGLIRLFGYLQFSFPLGWTLAAVLFTGGAVFLMITFHLKKIHGENLLEEIRRDSV